MTKLRIATRSSALALWQANHVAALLSERAGVETKLVHISTQGDRERTEPLESFGGVGVFTREVQRALLDGRADLAVHSLKDLPTELPADLHIAAISEREDVRDALVARAGIEGFSDLPYNALVGTSSLRRQAQIRAARPDLRLEPIRGNVGTRLRKLDEGQFDAIILAAAGLHRLGLAGRITEHLSTELVLPAVGQGALAIETRRDDANINQIVSRLNHETTRLTCQAERAFLKGLGGGCLVPIAAQAEIVATTLLLTGLVASTDGSEVVRGKLSGPSEEAEALGDQLAQQLIAQGADRILARG